MDKRSCGCALGGILLVAAMALGATSALLYEMHGGSGSGVDVVSADKASSVGSWSGGAGVEITLRSDGTFRAENWPTIGRTTARWHPVAYAGKWEIQSGSGNGKRNIVLEMPDLRSTDSAVIEIWRIRQKDGSAALCVGEQADSPCDLAILRRH